MVAFVYCHININTPFEQLHNKVCKNILGIRSNGSGIASKAELGRFPLIIFIAHLADKFYRKIYSNPLKLSYSALISERELHQNGKKSWVTYIEKCGLNPMSPTFNPISNDQILKDKYVPVFFDKIRSQYGTSKVSGNKLRTYAKFKVDYKMEKYLNASLPQNLVRHIAKLRTSTHSLAIETGRYARPRLPPDKRLCVFCSAESPEDEVHFLLECTLYSDFRSELMDAFPEINAATENGDILVQIMQTSNECQLRALGIFISKSFRSRKEKNAHQTEQLIKPLK